MIDVRGREVVARVEVAVDAHEATGDGHMHAVRPDPGTARHHAEEWHRVACIISHQADIEVVVRQHGLGVALPVLAEEIAERGGLPQGVTYFQKPVHYAKLEELLHQCQILKVQRLGEKQ